MHFLWAPVLAVLALAATLFFLDKPARQDVPRDDDLCLIDPGVASDVVTFLFDFKKPLDVVPEKSPGNLLRDLTLELDRDTEIQVFFLTGSTSAPRALLKRLCKPYDNDDLHVEEAKDQRGVVRDCDDLPAQLADDVRRSATRFCASREALQRRLDVLATNAWPDERVVTNAYLVEAFEDIRMEFSERQGPHQLHVFSDMMQHANWYSHLDLEWMDWDYDKFSELLNSRRRLFRPRHDNSDLRVDVYYLPRNGKTDQPRMKELHRQFWRSYFGNARVAFHDQAPAPAYSAKPLMNLLTDEELAARERAATERLLIELKNEQEALEREQRELEAERQRQAEAERQKEQERQRQAEAEQRLEMERRSIAEAERQAAEQAALARREAAEAAPDSSQPVERQSAEVTAPPCPLIISSNVEELRPAYPNRGGGNYGDAVITVRYVVDEAGETVDEEVAVVAEQSSADRIRFFNRFARAAVEKVRSWTFSFAEPNDQSCTKRRTSVTSFKFQYD